MTTMTVYEQAPGAWRWRLAIGDHSVINDATIHTSEHAASLAALRVIAPFVPAMRVHNERGDVIASAQPAFFPVDPSTLAVDEFLDQVAQKY
ncbi:MAG: hypothetical protein ABI411_19840 [Tahibacter sp.]